MSHSVLRNDMVICLQKVLIVFINRNCLAYRNRHPYDVAMLVMLNYVVIMLSLTFSICMLYCILQVQIRDSGKEETALAVSWVTDGVDRCRVGFVPWQLIKHMGKYNGVLV